MRKEKLTLNLSLFGEGTGASPGGEGWQEGEGNADAGQNRAEQANVVYGKAPAQDTAPVPQAAAEEKEHEPTPQEKETEFEELIKGKYRDAFYSRVQDIIDRRFGETKDLEEKMAQAQPLFDVMASRYGVDASDLKAIAKAVQEDDSYFEQEAAEKGIPVKTLREMKRMERENAQLREAREAMEQQEQAQQVYGGWMREAEQLKEIYPDFDFETEIGNPQFVSLLKAPGVDVRTAYEVIHRDEIIGGAMQHTAKTVAQKMVNNIAARGTRPPEGGAGGQGALTFKSDVNSLDKKDIIEICRRVAKGERIEF